MAPPLYILHLEKRVDRLVNLLAELKGQNITNYALVDGFVDLAAVFRGINQSHKRIIRIARQLKLKSVTIAEDDICFSAPGAWDYYCGNEPEDYDLYLGMVYEGKIEKDRIMKDPYSFSGLTLYTVHERFYDTFLGMKEMNHLDKELGSFAGQYKYIVCNPFVCKQMNGYSDQKKKEMKYDKYLIGKKMFGVNS